MKSDTPPSFGVNQESGELHTVRCKLELETRYRSERLYADVYVRQNSVIIDLHCDDFAKSEILGFDIGELEKLINHAKNLQDYITTHKVTNRKESQ